MLTLVLTLVVLTGLVGLALAGLLRRSPGEPVLYCPTNERLVEVGPDACRTIEDGLMVGSRWDCQRPCLEERERAIMRAHARS